MQCFDILLQETRWKRSVNDFVSVLNLLASQPIMDPENGKMTLAVGESYSPLAFCKKAFPRCVLYSRNLQLKILPQHVDTALLSSFFYWSWFIFWYLKLQCNSKPCWDFIKNRILHRTITHKFIKRSIKIWQCTWEKIDAWSKGRQMRSRILQHSWLAVFYKKNRDCRTAWN